MRTYTLKNRVKVKGLGKLETFEKDKDYELHPRTAIHLKKQGFVTFDDKLLDAIDKENKKQAEIEIENKE